MESVSIKEKQSWTLEQKLNNAMMNIDDFYHHFDGKVYLAFSGGLDSSFLKFLVDRFTDMCGYPRVKCVFNNTTNEYKEILDFVKSKGEEVTWLRPKITFAESLKVNGYPLVSKEQAQYIYEAKNTASDKLRNLRINGRVKVAKSGATYRQGKISDKWLFLVDEDVKITHKCCQVLKKDPVKKFEKETGLHPIVGTTYDESSLRLMGGYLNGSCNTYDGNRPISKPLSPFRREDVWNLIKANNVPYCSVYDDQIIDGFFVKGEERTGCAYCAFGEHLNKSGETKFDRLYHREPSRYKSMMDKLGYRDALHLVGISLPDDHGSQQKLF